MAAEKERAELEKMQAKVDKLNAQRDELAAEAKVAAHEMDGLVMYVAAADKVEAMSDTERAALAQVVHAEGMATGERVGRPGRG